MLAGVQGTGGVGKTALAVVLAHRLKDRYPDAQLYLNLRGAGESGDTYSTKNVPAVTSAEAMRTVIQSFKPDAKLPATLARLTPIYRSELVEAGRVLLVLDNAANADQVQPLLPPANCLLLLTSRTQIHIPGLATRNLDYFLPEKSRELLLALSPRLKGFEFEAADLCGHLPLALQVFARAVNEKKLTPVNELIQRLREGKDRLAPVDAAFQVSYEFLDHELRRKWTLLAVFPGNFDLGAAAAVWEKSQGVQLSTVDLSEARDAMQALFNANLVEWNNGTGRFRLHDLVRQFCDSKLTNGERDAAQLRHAQHAGFSRRRENGGDDEGRQPQVEGGLRRTAGDHRTGQDAAGHPGDRFRGAPRVRSSDRGLRQGQADGRTARREFPQERTHRQQSGRAGHRRSRRPALGDQDL